VRVAGTSLRSLWVGVPGIASVGCTGEDQSCDVGLGWVIGLHVLVSRPRFTCESRGGSSLDLSVSF